MFTFKSFILRQRFILFQCAMVLYLINIGTYYVSLSIKPSRNEDIKKTIQLFSQDRPGMGDLGVLWPVASDHVGHIVSIGPDAIPYLIPSLRSSNAMIVGQSAYCLDLLKATNALPDVQRVRDNLKNSSGAVEQEYEIDALDNYIRDHKYGFSDEPHSFFPG